MELKIISPSSEDGFIKAIEFNHEELKAEIAGKMENYKALVFTEETIKEAKADRANLRKLKDAIETERKRIKKLCNEPYLAFEAKVKEITALIDEPIGLIDAQIKEVEERKKQEKRAAIEEVFQSLEFPFELELGRIWDEKWLNASVSMKSITDELETYAHDVKVDMETLGALPEFGFEAQECYKQTLDLNTAIGEAKRMSDIQKAKEEARRREEAAKAAAEEARSKLPQSPPTMEAPQVPEKEEERFTVSFSCTGTRAQLAQLKEYLIASRIEYRPL